MINFSSAAINEIGRLKSKQQPNVLFRLRVKPGGCSGWLYDVSFDETVTGEDQVFDVNSIKVVVDADTINYINNLRLDYSEDLMGGGFRFHNSLAIATCSCGNSFSMS
ncbi:iron-sulfur cluster assembly accessory protein [Sphaerospermopsis aphanizomenoides BCCUSP55]|uniref:HesB/IscA family protein n=1 Tax=Sphaerospermopsis aphanizomenoides TaxID=459663 RepID=UPI000A91ED7E|nr:iron-sulfur cluster assembly accessory protein [Sphaerospermopsis aphanizomenoides]MBK1989931.1 iron-sulfur cluster assembly accessory protein [Sphaerospermopsis aphanizomenoides BCCUSP55]